MKPLEYLENLSDKVINNRFNDDGEFYLFSYFQVIKALVECGAFSSEEELEKAFQMHDQLLLLCFPDKVDEIRKRYLE